MVDKDWYDSIQDVVARFYKERSCMKAARTHKEAHAHWVNIIKLIDAKAVLESRCIEAAKDFEL